MEITADKPEALVFCLDLRETARKSRPTLEVAGEELKYVQNPYILGVDLDLYFPSTAQVDAFARKLSF